MKKYNRQPTLHLEVHKRMQECVNTKNILVDESLDAYFKCKYGYSLDDIKSIVENTNNFKLKGFERTVQGDTKKFYDNGTLILNVVGNIIEGFTINQVWKENNYEI